MQGLAILNHMAPVLMILVVHALILFGKAPYYLIGPVEVEHIFYSL